MQKLKKLLRGIGVGLFASRRGYQNLGSYGEKLAGSLLKHKGLKILARNYRCPAGEVDLIALENGSHFQHKTDTIVFVEVKTRSSDRYTNPESAVDARKKQHLKKVADYYLARRSADEFNIRFDIISIVIADGQKPQIKHIVDAFK